MDLHYVDYGEQGEPLVILHGFLGASGNWHTLASKAFAEHVHVFALDQRNHGRSPHSDTFDYPTLADDLRDFLDARGLGAAHVLGHSMGGKTAMFFALAYPERVRKLVVVDIAPRAYPPHHDALLDALNGLDLTAARSRSQIDQSLSTHVADPGVRQFLLKNLAYDREAKRYSWMMNLDVLTRDYHRINVALDGGTYDCPTLFVRGERSDYIKPEDEPEIRRFFPQAEVVTIPGAGHWVHAEAPEPFAEAVLEFLR